jgi:maltooligosyltrehalose trehalohydrolase
MKSAGINRRLHVGAEVVSQGVHFRVWAPQRRTVQVVIEDDKRQQTFELQAEPEGYFSGLVASARAGTRYRYRLDGADQLLPDPAARFQPEGPHGPSQVIDPHSFQWTDQDWPGITLPGQVMYELHLGTFTPEGTFAAAARELAELADLGVTVIELMPVAEFPGQFGWGYDGVNLFAPARSYGTPDDLRHFIDRAHALGLGVILDVVYNHLGPDGNYLAEFSADYFTSKHKTDWGAAINFDGQNCAPVREYYLANASYWIEEFHFDGFRLDATQNIYDDSPDHILAALTRRVRAAAKGRGTIIVGENEPQHVKLVQAPERGGYGLDALWNDDFHHSAMVALTGRNEAYYTDYLGKPQEFISAVKYGYLYQGQWYRWQQKRRGTSDLSLPPTAYINFIQNHDQIANSGKGERCHALTSPGRYRAMTALLLLAPGTPLLFQGQEFAASQPFYYFADHQPELAKLVFAGRNKELSQFRSLATPEAQASLLDPADPQTFARCKLDFTERTRHAPLYQMHRDLLRLRREDTAFSAQRRGSVDGAVLADEAFVLRFFGAGANDPHPLDDRLLIINLGRDLVLNPAPEPLLAPPSNQEWAVLWSSEDPRYGGLGTAPLETTENWLIPGHAAIVLQPTRRTEMEEGMLTQPHTVPLANKELSNDIE